MSLLSARKPELLPADEATEADDVVNVAFRWLQLHDSLQQLGIASGRQGMSKAMGTSRRQEIQNHYGLKTDTVVNGAVRNAREAEIRARDAFISAYLGKRVLTEEDTQVADNPAYTQWVQFRNAYAGSSHAGSREDYMTQLSECIRVYEEANLIPDV